MPYNQNERRNSSAVFVFYHYTITHFMLCVLCECTNNINLNNPEHSLVVSKFLPEEVVEIQLLEELCSSEKKNCADELSERIKLPEADSLVLYDSSL